MQPTTDAPPRRPGLTRRLLWFAGLWAAGVFVVGAVSLVLRLVLRS